MNGFESFAVPVTAEIPYGIREAEMVVSGVFAL
jgi:hypothetical protein